MWFLFAFIAAVLWSVVSTFDKFSIHSLLTRASQGLIISGMFSGIGLCFADWGNVDSNLVLWSIVAGLLLQFSQFCYFKALKDEEVGDLTAFGSAYPLLVALLTIPLGKYLTLYQWLGILLVAIGVIVLRWKRAQSNSNNTFFHILGYVVGLALSSLVVSEVLDAYDFFSALGPYCLGLIVGGLLPLMFTSERREFFRVFNTIKPKLWLFGWIELLNVLAVACEVYAIGIGHPALVNTVASTEPAIVFVMAYFFGNIKGLEHMFPKVSQIHHKLLITTVIIIGLGLITWN